MMLHDDKRFVRIPVEEKFICALVALLPLEIQELLNQGHIVLNVNASNKLRIDIGPSVEREAGMRYLEQITSVAREVKANTLVKIH